MPSPNIPLFFPGDLYVNGLQIEYLSSKTITLKPGSARNTTNVNDITLDAEVVIDGRRVGANGCDIDVFPAMVTGIYAVFVIGDSTLFQPTAGLFVAQQSNALTSDPIPSLPFGYDMYRRVGWVTLTNGNIEIFYQYGTDQTRTIYYDEPLEVLSAGAATSYNTVNLDNVVPDRACEVNFQLDFTPNSAANVAEFTIGAGLGISMFEYGCGVAARQKVSTWMPVTTGENNAAISYKVTSGSDALTMDVIGYKDYLVPR